LFGCAVQVKLNFPATKYAELSTFMDSVSLEDLVMAIRRQSQGFARGSSGSACFPFARRLLRATRKKLEMTDDELKD
jgi:hypothetical protein